MRSRRYGLDFSKKLFLTAILAILSMLSLGMLPNEALAAPDKFGIEQLYPNEVGEPVWFLNSEDPEEDDNFLITSANNVELEEEDSDSFGLDAETGTEKHGVRIHADSPDGEWKNVEMTGYFKLNEGNDQFTLIARQGPTYNDNGGCGAYGYYGSLDANGDAYFKKKLFHYGGYSDRTAQRQGVVGDLNDRWVGIKMIAYNLDGGDVKLELWVDDGDETNNWQKATEYVDDGNWEVGGSDCGRSDDIIDEGTRGGFRADDSQFEFKKLSIREIDAGQGGAIVEGNNQGVLSEVQEEGIDNIEDSEQSEEEEDSEQSEEEEDSEQSEEEEDSEQSEEEEDSEQSEEEEDSEQSEEEGEE